ncbi:MAG TPA: acyl-CoA dehydrogenase family protein [Bdellovibrionota bacterium]|jgi:alkylation response protein AidB-like acyl-CoA dehydrogenase|nr:acyl-CoA dehydrogenase family protein [Bdellovibrionota bacterium]
MKSVYLTEEHDLFRRSVRTFMEKEIAPHATKWEAEGHIPKEAWAKMGQNGFLGILFPEALGGAGSGIFHAMVFLEELARSRMGGFCAAVSVQQFIATGALAQVGSDALRAKYVAPSIRGLKVGAISISEPDAGSDVGSIQARAVRDGDSWVLNGAKTWVTNGFYADFYVVACKTDPAAGPKGISLIVVEAGTPGLQAKKLQKVGWHSSDTAELSLENVRVPLTNLVGQENMGFAYIMQTFVLERLTAAATSLGSAIVAMEDTVTYMNQRKAFGKPILKFQALRHRLADLYAELEAVRQLVYHAAWLLEQKEPAVKEASMAKLLATEFSKRAIDECLQFHGGFGYVEEYPIARAYRDARVGTIVAGTSEIMREIIARDFDALS